MSEAMDNDAVLAQRYRWFCEVGWKVPVLNEPEVILNKADAKMIDRFIQAGMKRWPIRRNGVAFSFDEPKGAA